MENSLEVRPGVVLSISYPLGEETCRIASLTVDGFEDSRRLPAAWECDEDHLSNLSEQSEQDEQIVEISEAELIQVALPQLKAKAAMLLRPMTSADIHMQLLLLRVRNAVACLLEESKSLLATNVGS